MKCEKVLVPLDGSPEAEAILPFIEEIAGPLDMKVILLRVVPLTSLDVVTMAKLVGPGGPIIKELDALGSLEPLVGVLKAEGVRAAARVRIGDPPTEIVAAAKEIGADLIAMATHGRRGLGRLVFGSAAETVLRTAPIPVFCWRPASTAPESTT